MKNKNIKMILGLLLVLTLSLSVGCSKKEDKEVDNKENEEVVEEEVTKEEDTKENQDVSEYDEDLSPSLKETKDIDQLAMPEKGDEIAIIKTNMGDIKVRLFDESTSRTVYNFKELSKKGYYDGVIFHRVIEDFMIQGGDPEGTGMGGQSIWGKPFRDEFDLYLRHYRGALSMANSGPGTNGSQFFIVQNSDEDMQFGETKNPDEQKIIDNYGKGGTPNLDFKHSVFGQVFEGMDIVDSIAGVETDPSDKPLEDVVIETIEIVEYK